MASVELQQVEKVFENGTKVVSDFNLAIRDHEFIVLVGPSGCGKSTTLRMIAGLEAVSGGTISIDGRVVNEVPPKDRDIAMVFQNYALYPHMSVYDNMAFGLRMRKTDRKTLDHKVRQAASTLGIEGLLDRLPKQLSGGQRQRVALGRAIVRDPKCFLFDEPLSNLDARLRIEMRAELKRLHLELKTTTIYVTHDQEEAITLGDRVVVMQGGTIQQCDQALKIYREPVNRFVAAFLGCPPMNFLNGRLDAKGAQMVFETGQEWIKVPAWAMAALAAHAGQPIVLGIRPEAVSDAAHARFPIGEQAIAATVSLVQPLGHKMDVYLKTTSGAQLTAQLDSGAPIQLGDRLTIHMDPERIHFFAPGENGKNIAPRSSIAG